MVQMWAGCDMEGVPVWTVWSLRCEVWDSHVNNNSNRSGLPYLWRYSGSDSVECCLELTEWWDGTDSRRCAVLLYPLPLIRWLTDSENFSPNPLI